ncbi:MAG TPA: pyruvate dehydrogenase (acetyl-transferring) E1 component subunit alpha [Opitutaceae bacterium]|nr:pyruvate dehydrogenase (acetyl-transferring) E1 component subunit alpha [Opitutaceae bacterium]
MSTPTTSAPVPPHSEAAEHDVRYAKSPVNSDLAPEKKVKLYTDMVRIRLFEDRSLRVYQQGKIGGFLHLYNGQEAVAVGTCSLLGEHDHVITAYRDHGHAIAVGMNMGELMAEMQGKFTGCSKGKGGSMHFFSPEKHFWGGHGIVGGQTPLGLGIAYALKYQGKKGCCLCYLGDGAINQGAFHESLNLAALWDVPVIYVIENNGYSMGTSQKRSSAGEILAQRAEGYGIEWAVINGNSMYEVRARTWEAMHRARERSKPTLLEMRTYRYRGHSVADANAEKYRTKAEIETYKRDFDPITLFKAVLIREGLLDDAKIEAIHAAAKEEVEAAVKFADESPVAPVSEIFTDVYAGIDEAPSQQLGTHFFNKDAQFVASKRIAE